MSPHFSFGDRWMPAGRRQRRLHFSVRRAWGLSELFPRRNKAAQIHLIKVTEQSPNSQPHPNLRAGKAVACCIPEGGSGPPLVDSPTTKPHCHQTKSTSYVPIICTQRLSERKATTIPFPVRGEPVRTLRINYALVHGAEPQYLRYV